MKGWREPYFTSGRLYQVQIDIPDNIVGSLPAGEFLTFISESYSPYDGATVYLFRDSSQEYHQIFWLDEAPEPGTFFKEA